MKFKLYKNYGALNSKPVFDAFEQGLSVLGLQSAEGGIPVIWSALWQGRMAKNREIYISARQKNRPVIILEIGNLCRGITWRVGINHVNNSAIFANNGQLDTSRNHKLKIPFLNYLPRRRDEILIACQHEKSFQWQGQPPVSQWVSSTVHQIRKFSNRPIVVRPHPRSPFVLSMPNVKLDTVIKIPNSYDDYNINYNYHCVVNHNSGPSIQSALQGTPVICDATSLAYPVSDVFENIDTPTLPDRTDWFLKLLHTEWTIDELAQGIPQQRLLPELEKYF
jgi:hypothetical protein